MQRRFRLRTKLLLAMIAVSTGLTAMSLLAVSRAIERRERSRIEEDLKNSVLAFRTAEHQREISLTRTAELMADLPIVRALMTTQHPATIQDASADLWAVSGADLFAMAGQRGELFAFHVRSANLSRDRAQQLITETLQRGSRWELWEADGHLYEAALQPIFFGKAAQNNALGFLAVGFEIDERVAGELSAVSGSDVAFRYGSSVLRSSLSAQQQRALEAIPVTSFQATDSAASQSSGATTAELNLGGEHFLASTLLLSSAQPQQVQLTVLKSLDRATAFLHSLNRLLLVLGIIAVLAGSVLIFLISHTITRPLQALVDGVRALGRGDYQYRLKVHTGDEVGELTTAFDQMRSRIQQAQRELVDAERLATIGQMASSISHDLRHHLAAIYANAEFLADDRRGPADRHESYEEIRSAVLEMTELIESLLEFSRTRESLRLEYGNVADSIDHAIHAVRLHRQYQPILIDVHHNGITEGAFDSKKLERVFHNLLLNACAAVPLKGGIIRVTIEGGSAQVKVWVQDNGGGVPSSVRERIFEPFFSYGKENGTGLGLNVAQKIVADHGGELRLESTSEQGTIFVVVLPLEHPAPERSLTSVEAHH